MKRRTFIAGLGSAAAWPLVARAQQPGRMRRIGVLTVVTESDPEARSSITAFATRLRELGWMAGENVRIDYRWGGYDVTRMTLLAKELIELKPDVLLAATYASAVALRQYTLVIPIVFTQVGDPVANGLVSNLARPEGNITGFDSYEFEIGSKWIEALKKCAPGLRRAAIVFDPGNTSWPQYLRAMEAAARSLSIQLFPLSVQTDAEIERALAGFATEPNGSVVVVPSPGTMQHREKIVALVARHRLPAMYPYRFFAAEGGLMSFGSDLSDQYRRAASYVDRLLKGEKPADLPVQQPNKFQLVINLKTAKALGLTIPETLLATADEVIQ